MAGYRLSNLKWGNGTLGTSGGQVTWSFATTVGQYFAFDAQISDAVYQGLVRQAFQAWENVANIDFVEVTDSSNSDIRLGWDFIDGGYGTVGQATYSYYGGTIGTYDQAEIRFDTAETWTTSTVDVPNAVNFYAVAQHEIGHALGLDHSDDYSTIMYPFSNPQTELSAADIAGAQAIYGPKAAGARYLGTNGNDTYFGQAGAEEIYGFGGSDTLGGGGGNDVIDGGTGIDFGFFAGQVDDYTITKRFDGGLQVRDTFNRYGEGVDQLTNVERLSFEDGYLAWDLTGNAGKAYRLYQAAFDRIPDEVGLGYWIRELDAGHGDLAWMAYNFIISNEFRATYGSPSTVSNAQFLNLIYDNVLNRSPDQSGYTYWMNELARGFSRERVLASFSESVENQANVAGATMDGIWYL